MTWFILCLVFAQAELIALVEIAVEDWRAPGRMEEPADRLLQESLEKQVNIGRQMRTNYSSLLDLSTVGPQAIYRRCARKSCEETLQAQLQGLSWKAQTEDEDRLLLDINSCPRVTYLLHRDQVTYAKHLEIITELLALAPELESTLHLNSTDIEALARLAEFVALGGTLTGASEALHQFLGKFHEHYVSDLLIGSFEQGKIATFELMWDLMDRLEERNPVTIYVTSKETFTALLKILTLYTSYVSWGDFLIMELHRTTTGDVIKFLHNGNYIENDYCGNPCLLSVFMEKYRSKRMLSSPEHFQTACAYLGDDDLSWSRYYLMFAMLSVLMLLFKGIDWVVQKTAPRPKQE